MKKNSVLIVEDEKLMCDVIRDYFEDAGFDVFDTGDGITAMELCDDNEYDIIILDIMLPSLDGISLCRHIRKKRGTPIIMLTAISDENDKLKCYDLGADDYITKPFSPKILIAKANALISRSKGITPGTGKNTVSAAGIEIDINAYSVFIDGKEIELTPKEFNLLLILMENKGHVLSRDTLLTRVWGMDYFGDPRAVDTHIKKLRAKLGNKAAHIKTMIKAGYKFDENI